MIQTMVAITDKCEYCESPEVLDNNAWWCNECWDAHYKEFEEISAYEKQTPLTRDKALVDLTHTKASGWGAASRAIEDAATEIARLAKRPIGG